MMVEGDVVTLELRLGGKSEIQQIMEGVFLVGRQVGR